MDSFLGSPSANKLERLTSTVNDISTAGTERLVTGLSKSVIKDLVFFPNQINPEASRILADFVHHTPTNLVQLALGAGGGGGNPLEWIGFEARGDGNPVSHFVDIMMPALSRNSTIQELSLFGLYDESFEENVMNLLIKNSSIKKLKCEAAEAINDACIRNTAVGLSKNTTLHALEVDFAGGTLDVGPIFEALLLAPVALQELHLRRCHLADQNEFVIAKVLQDPRCQLKELELSLGWDDDAAMMTMLFCCAEKPKPQEASRVCPWL